TKFRDQVQVKAVVESSRRQGLIVCKPEIPPLETYILVDLLVEFREDLEAEPLDPGRFGRHHSIRFRSDGRDKPLGIVDDSNTGGEGGYAHLKIFHGMIF